MQAEKRTWRERHHGVWGKTLYSGLYIQTEKGEILISQLSHGLRVFGIKDKTNYYFEEYREVIHLPEEFVQEALAMLEADEAFQKKIFDEFIKLFPQST